MLEFRLGSDGAGTGFTACPEVKCSLSRAVKHGPPVRPVRRATLLGSPRTPEQDWFLPLHESEVSQILSDRRSRRIRRARTRPADQNVSFRVPSRCTGSHLSRLGSRSWDTSCHEGRAPHGSVSAHPGQSNRSSDGAAASIRDNSPRVGSRTRPRWLRPTIDGQRPCFSAGISEAYSTRCDGTLSLKSSRWTRMSFAVGQLTTWWRSLSRWRWWGLLRSTQNRMTAR